MNRGRRSLSSRQAPGGGMPLPAAVRRPRRGGVAQGFSEPPASLDAGALHRPVGRRRGRGHSHLPAGARPPSGRYPTARAQMRCRRGVWRPRAAQPSARPRSNCRDRPLLCREAHVHEGQQWTTRWWLRIERSVWPFLPKKKKGRNTFLLHRRCVFVVPSIFLFFLRAHLGTPQLSLSVCALAF